MEKITPDQIRIIGEICRAFSRRLDKGAKPGTVVTELIRAFPEPSSRQKKILRQVKLSLRKAAASEKSKPVYENILSVLCSWGDTIEEDAVLDQLKTITADVSRKFSLT